MFRSEHGNVSSLYKSDDNEKRFISVVENVILTHSFTTLGRVRHSVYLFVFTTLRSLRFLK